MTSFPRITGYYRGVSCQLYRALLDNSVRVERPSLEVWRQLYGALLSIRFDMAKDEIPASPGSGCSAASASWPTANCASGRGRGRSLCGSTRRNATRRSQSRARSRSISPVASLKGWALVELAGIEYDAEIRERRWDGLQRWPGRFRPGDGDGTAPPRPHVLPGRLGSRRHSRYPLTTCVYEERMVFGRIIRNGACGRR